MTTAPPLSRISGSLVVLIEQAAARNADPEAIAAALDVPLPTVQACWHRMDVIAGITPGKVPAARLPPISDRAPHGTPAARRRHNRRGEQLCEQCAASRRASDAQYREREAP